MRRMILVSLALPALVAIGTGPAQAQSIYLSAYTACAITSGDPDSTYVIWTTVVLDPDPYLYPDWVGYDVLRRAVPSCDPPVRVNEESIPRQIGSTQTHYFGAVAPGGTTYEYTVVPVDADHQTVSIPGFCQPCIAYVSCPQFSAPFTIGTLTDLGWALLINPCPDDCYPSGYFEGAYADLLRPYAGSGTPIKFFGTANCGTVEGCALDIDHWELATGCGATPTARRSWGSIKTIYR